MPIAFPDRAPAPLHGEELLLIDRQFQVGEESISRYFHIASRPVAAPGLSSASTVRIEIDASYETYAWHLLRIHRDGAVIDAFANADFRVTDATDDPESGLVLGMTHVTAFVRDVRVGDVVEYAYSIEGDQPALRGKFASSFSMHGNGPVGRIHQRLLWPSARRLYLQAYATDLQPMIVQKGNTTLYTWEVHNHPGFPPEDNVPSWFDWGPWVQLSEFATWQEVVAWASPLYEQASQPTPELRERVEQWTRDRGRDGAIEQAIRFVQDDVHYRGFELGVGGLVPRPPELVIARRFGDCKDKAVLMVALLRALEIEAWPALVDSDDREHVKGRLPSPYAFDHVIVKAIVAGRPRWIDTTVSFERGKLDVRSNPEYGAALVLAQGTRDLEVIPEDLPREPTTFVSESFVVGDDNRVRLDVHTRYRAAKARSMRYELATRTLDEVQRDYASFYRRLYGELSVASPLRVADDEASGVLEVRESYVLTELWRDGGADLSAWLVTDVLPELGEHDRRSPLALPNGVFLRQKIELKAPPGYVFTALDDDVKGALFEYHFRESFEDGMLVLRYDLRTHADSVPVSELAAYRAQLKGTKETAYNIEGPDVPLEARSSNRTSDRIGEPLKWLLLVALLGLTVAVLVGGRNMIERRLRKGRFVSRMESDAGETPHAALPIGSLAQLARHMEELRCSCVGRPAMTLTREPAKVQYMGHELWHQAAECSACKARTTRYFRVNKDRGASTVDSR